MAKVKRSAASPAIPAPAVTASKAKKSAPAAAKVKGSAPTAAKVKGSAPAATEVNRSAPTDAEVISADTTPAAKVVAAAAAPNVIEIPSSPDYSAGAALGSSKKKTRKRPAPVDFDDEIEMWTPREKRRLEEDCQILSGDPLAAAEVTPTAAAANDDIAVVAERGQVACRDYPHPRSTCAKNPFSTTPHERYCDKCFCYVCDIAAPCVYWMGAGGHCHASEKDKHWKNMRSLKRKCFCYVCDVAAPCVSWKGAGGHCHASDKDKKWKSLRLLRQKEKK
ncbi:hypothetical protein EJB05_23270, partial [Eragrostis curvula]